MRRLRLNASKSAEFGPYARTGGSLSLKDKIRETARRSFSLYLEARDFSRARLHVNTVRNNRKNKVGHSKFHLANEACFTIFHMYGKYTVEDLARLYEVSPRTMDKYIKIAKERALSGELDYLEKGEYGEYEID